MKFITTPAQAVKHLAKLQGKDRAALKILVEEIEMMNHKDKEHHWLFAKLYLAIFNMELQRTENSRATVDSLRFYLQKSMDDHFKDIQRSFETLKDIQALNDKNIELDHLNSIEIGSDEVLTKKIVKPAIGIDELKSNLIEKINTSLNDKKNYG